MFIGKHLRKQTRRQAVHAALSISLFSSFVASGQALAEKPIPAIKRSSGHMGVSAVVLPRCSVTVGKAHTQGWVQPVEVQCTHNTEYGLGVSSKTGQEVSIRSTPPNKTSPNKTLPANAAANWKTVKHIVGQGNGNKSLYLIEQAQVSRRLVKIGKVEVTILAIDF